MFSTPTDSAWPESLPAPLRRTYDALWLLDHTLTPQRTERWIGRQRAANEAAIDAHRASRGPGGVRPMPEVEGAIAPARFHAEFLRPNRPVVLRGAASAWASSAWTPQWFARHYGQERDAVVSMSTEEMTAPGHQNTATDTTVGNVIDRMAQGDRNAYLRFSPIIEQHPELLSALDHDWLRALADHRRTGQLTRMFLGGAGSNTHLHAGPAGNLFIQVYGRKRWVMYSTADTPSMHPERRGSPFFYSRLDPWQPDHERFPLFRHARGWEATLEPGDVLYVPALFWHQVANLTDTIGVSWRWYAPAAFLRSGPAHFLFMLLAHNPPLWRVRREGNKFNTIFALVR